MPRKKKEYKCVVCGKTYYGYRKSHTCSLECSMKKMLEHIKKLKDKSSPEYQKALERGKEYSSQFLKRKGKWYQKWLEGLARAIERK